MHDKCICFCCQLDIMYTISHKGIKDLNWLQVSAGFISNVLFWLLSLNLLIATVRTIWMKFLKLRLKGSLKFVSTTLLLVCFVSLIESNRKRRKNVFISLRKLFLLLRSSNFNLSSIQMSWHLHMPKRETRNTFYWITWEVNSVW